MIQRRPPGLEVVAKFFFRPVSFANRAFFLGSDLESCIFSIFLINFNHLSHGLLKNSAS
jgi:hypothetical protein